MMRFPVGLIVAVVGLPLVLGAQIPNRTAQPKPPAAKAAPKPVVAIAAPELKIPAVTSLTLANGLRVFLALDNELPSVSGKLVFDAGSMSDPEGKAGLAAFVAEQMLAGGTYGKSPTDVRRFLADRAAEVTAQVGLEAASFRFWTLADHSADLLTFLAENATTPAFERVAFTTAKERLRRQTERRNDAAQEVAAREFATGAFGAAIAAPAELAGVTRFQREDLFDFHRRAYRPETAQLLVSGDFDPVAMRALLEKTFGSWKPVPVPATAKRTAVFATSAAVRAASVPNSAVSAIEIGYPLESLSVDEFAVLNILSQVLARPLEAMRNPADRSTPMVEYLAAQVRAYDGPASFRITGRARVRETMEAVRNTMTALDSIRDGSVTAAEFNAAKTRTLQRFHAEFSRPQALLDLYGAAPKIWGTPADFMLKVSAKLASASLEEGLQTAKKVFVPGRRVVAIAAEFNDFRSPLELIKVPVTTVNMTIAPAPPEGPPTAEQAARGAEKWQKMRAALGVDRRPIRDGEVQLKGKVYSGRTEAIEQTIRWLAPATLRTEQRTERESIAYYDPDTSWFYDGFRVGPFSTAGVRIYRGEVFRFVHWLAARNLAPPLTVQDVGSGVIRVTDGAEVVEIALNDKTSLPETIWYTDPANGQKAEERMSDYKDFGGVPYWGRLEMYRNEGLVGELTTVSARFNFGLTAEQLERRPEVK